MSRPLEDHWRKLDGGEWGVVVVVVVVEDAEEEEEKYEYW